MDGEWEEHEELITDEEGVALLGASPKDPDISLLKVNSKDKLKLLRRYVQMDLVNAAMWLKNKKKDSFTKECDKIITDILIEVITKMDFYKLLKFHWSVFPQIRRTCYRSKKLVDAPLVYMSVDIDSNDESYHYQLTSNEILNHTRITLVGLDVWKSCMESIGATAPYNRDDQLTKLAIKRIVEGLQTSYQAKNAFFKMYHDYTMYSQTLFERGVIGVLIKHIVTLLKKEGKEKEGKNIERDISYLVPNIAALLSENERQGYKDFLKKDLGDLSQLQQYRLITVHDVGMRIAFHQLYGEHPTRCWR